MYGLTIIDNFSHDCVIFQIWSHFFVLGEDNTFFTDVFFYIHKIEIINLCDYEILPYIRFVIKP